MGTPPAFGSVHLVPMVTAFSRVHPDIHVELYVDDGRSDLVMEGLDVSIRVAASLKDTSQVAYVLTTTRQLLAASPSYLERHDAPRSITDLTHHNCISHVLTSPTNLWAFNGPEGRITVKVSGNMRANFGESLHQAALLGHGIIMLPTYMLADDVREGRLEVLLPEYRPEAVSIYAVVQDRKHLPLRLRLFLDFLIAHFKIPSWSVSDGSETHPTSSQRRRPGPADTQDAALS